MPKFQISTRAAGLEISAEIRGKLVFQIDKPVGDVLCTLLCGLVLLQIFVKRFYTHIAAVGQKFRHGGILGTQAELYICFHP